MDRWSNNNKIKWTATRIVLNNYPNRLLMIVEMGVSPLRAVVMAWWCHRTVKIHKIQPMVKLTRNWWRSVSSKRKNTSASVCWTSRTSLMHPFLSTSVSAKHLNRQVKTVAKLVDNTDTSLLSLNEFWTLLPWMTITIWIWWIGVIVALLTKGLLLFALVVKCIFGMRMIL